jgi:hypothetical protein
MALPDPDNYKSWQEYARVLVQALAEADVDPTRVVAGSSNGIVIPPQQYVPDGYSPVWLSQEEAELYLGNPAFDPPTAADLFQIDTSQIAEAAITVQKIRDGAVEFDKIFDGAVGTQKLAALAVTEAKIKDLAVGTAKMQDLAVVTAKIGDAAIVTAKIGEAQIVEAKIADLAVNNTKIANLAVTSGKIANLAVGVAHIQDAAITDAKIGNVISSYSYNPATKAGWALLKDGSIEGTNITIYNPDGSVAFGSGSKVNLATQVIGALGVNSITGLGALALLNVIAPGNTTGFGALALQNVIDIAAQSTGLLDFASRISGAVDISRTAGFGSLAAVSYLTSGNISTYIGGAAIGRALIANAAIGTAQIDNAAITTALIQDAAINNAKIGDAQITSAKVAELTVGKLSSGLLDAIINVAGGRFVFTVGGSQLIIGNGFGNTNQFFLWYGPAQASVTTCSEANGTVYLRTDGSAYFGGTLSAGVISNSGRTTLASATQFPLGPFASAGGPISVTSTQSWGAILATGAEYLGSQNDPPQEADPFAAQHMVYRTSYTLEAFRINGPVTALAVWTEDVTSTSAWEFLGMSTGPEPMGRFAWRHRVGNSSTRTSSWIVGAVNDAYVWLTRGAIYRLADSQALGNISSNILQLSTVEQ